MATSIIDYIFRELAITYLDRNDLAQVSDEDLRSDTIGTKIGQGPVAMIPVTTAAVLPLGEPIHTARAAAPLSGGSGVVVETRALSRPPRSRSSRATKAIPAASAASSPWCATAPAQVRDLRHHHGCS